MVKKKVKSKKSDSKKWIEKTSRNVDLYLYQTENEMTAILNIGRPISKEQWKTQVKSFFTKVKMCHDTIQVLLAFLLKGIPEIPIKSNKNTKYWLDKLTEIFVQRAVTTNRHETFTQIVKIRSLSISDIIETTQKMHEECFEKLDSLDIIKFRENRVYLGTKDPLIAQIMKAKLWIQILQRDLEIEKSRHPDNKRLMKQNSIIERMESANIQLQRRIGYVE